MSDKKLRGSVINGYLKFIKKTWGKNGLDQCAKDCGFDPKKIAEGRWYDEELSISIIHWIAKNKGIRYVEACGTYTVKNLGLLSYVVRFMNIKTLLKKASDSYYDVANYGSVTVYISDNSAVVKMKDIAIDEFSCLVWRGVFKGMLEITKTKGTVKETQCQMKGAAHCEFLVAWE